MGGVVRRYIDFVIILLILTPLVLALFLQQHPYILLCSIFKWFLYFNTVEPPNSGCVGNFDDVPYSEVEP